MPVTMEMTANNRLLILRFLDPLTIDEIKDAAQLAGQEYLDKATFPVHGINDFSAIRRLPTHILTQGLALLRDPHPNRGQVLLVADSFILKSAATVFGSLSGREVHTFPTFENAHAYALYLLQTNMTSQRER